jgi:hypothetical protein
MFKDGGKDEILPPEISFTLGIDTSGAGALHHQTTAAVSQAQEDATCMRTIPTSLGAAGAGIDMANAAATDSFTPLLNKLAKFNDIVKDIADVRRHLDVLRWRKANEGGFDRFTRTLGWRGKFYLRLIL